VGRQSGGKHPMIIKFIKGIKNERPSVPRYVTTWGADQVIKYLESMDKHMLKNLTLKLTMLMAEVTA